MPVCVLQLVLFLFQACSHKNWISAPLPNGIGGVGFLRNRLWIILEGFVSAAQQLIYISK